MNYSIHTYKDILETLRDIEIEDEELRRKKWLCVFGAAFIGLVTVLLLVKYGSSHLTILELITSFGAGVGFGPIFAFVYYNTQADLLSTRKISYWNSLINNFQISKIELFKNSSLNEKELQKVLMEKIKEKINETLQYE